MRTKSTRSTAASPTFYKWLICAALFIPLLTLSASAQAPPCHPEVDAGVPQYTIGYGSLMETASKERTAPNTGSNLPVLVSGYERQWNTRGSLVGFSTTYLGVRIVSGKQMVAALYRVFDPADILATDQREAYYCRDQVRPDQIRMLDGSATPTTGQVWIYVNKPDAVDPPSERFPIVQSYVDIFLTGCFELAEKVVDKDLEFADLCIDTTQGWSPYWVNDRIYPRRPFIYQPNASQIDRLLQQMIPQIFSQIRIE